MTALRLAIVLLCVLYVSEAIFRPSRCCTQLGKEIPSSVLKRVKSYEIQKPDSNCQLHAVLLHLKRRTLCMSPENDLLQQWIEEQKQKVLTTKNPMKITEEEKIQQKTRKT